MGSMRQRSHLNARKRITVSKFLTRRSFILYLALTVKKRNVMNGRNNWNKKKLGETKNINRNKRSYLRRLELRWNKHVVMVIRTSSNIGSSTLPSNPHIVVVPHRVRVVFMAEILTIITSPWKKQSTIRLKSKPLTTSANNNTEEM